MEEKLVGNRLIFGHYRFTRSNYWESVLDTKNVLFTFEELPEIRFTFKTFTPILKHYDKKVLTGAGLRH